MAQAEFGHNIQQTPPECSPSLAVSARLPDLASALAKREVAPKRSLLMCVGTSVCPMAMCAAEAVASRVAGVATVDASRTLRVSNVILRHGRMHTQDYACKLWASEGIACTSRMGLNIIHGGSQPPVLACSSASIFRGARWEHSHPLPIDSAGTWRVARSCIPEMVYALHSAFYLACLQVYSVLHAHCRLTYIVPCCDKASTRQ